MRLATTALALMIFVVPGCAAQAPALTVFGAASLSDALADIKTQWEAGGGREALTYSTGSSSALRTQIEQGALADIFLSADTTNPQRLVDDGLADGEMVLFAGNRVVIIVPTGNPARIESAADLTRDDVCVIAAGENVPITRYATELVAALAEVSGFGEDFAAEYEANICSREDDVRAAVTKVEIGEGDVAIVYDTDARTADVQTVDLPAGVNVQATYGGVVLKRAGNLEAAHELLNWIAGPDGQEILSSHGFVPHN